MDVRAAVALEAGKPLTIETVKYTFPNVVSANTVSALKPISVKQFVLPKVGE